MFFPGPWIERSSMFRHTLARPRAGRRFCWRFRPCQSHSPHRGSGAPVMCWARARPSGSSAATKSRLSPAVFPGAARNDARWRLPAPLDRDLDAPLVLSAILVVRLVSSSLVAMRRFPSLAPPAMASGRSTLASQHPPTSRLVGADRAVRSGRDRSAHHQAAQSVTGVRCVGALHQTARLMTALPDSSPARTGTLTGGSRASPRCASGRPESR